jgi:hypothetical protein
LAIREFGMVTIFSDTLYSVYHGLSPGVAEGNSGDYEEEDHLFTPDPKQSSESDYGEIAK